MNTRNGVQLTHDSTCRVCLSDDANECIFNSRVTFGNRDSAYLWEKLEFYGGIEVKHGDGLPSKMCGKCVTKIRVAHDFKTQCQDTDAKLRLLRREAISEISDDSKLREEILEKSLPERKSSPHPQNWTNSRPKKKRTVSSRREWVEHGLSAEKTEEYRSNEKCDKQQEPSKSTTADVQRKPEICGICNKKFLKVVSMVKHLRVHKRESPGAVYTILRDLRKNREKNNALKENLNIGIQNTLVSDESNFLSKSRMDENFNGECSECPNGVGTMKLINTWIREELDSQSGDKDVSYQKSNIGEECLSNRISKETDSQRPPPHRCKDCRKDFETESKLAAHMKIHGSEVDDGEKNFKRFLCDQCSKTFRHNTGLMFHMRTHTGYKPHVCKYCGRGFTSNSNRTNHERTHTGDRPFVCHFCSAAFAKSCTLKAHITTHTGEANYHCKTCGKSFRRLKYLKEHSFTHTGEKPYACKICGTAYSHSGSLFVHERKCKAAEHDSRIGSMKISNETTVETADPLIYSPGLSFPNSDVDQFGSTENTKFEVMDARKLDPSWSNLRSA